MNDNKKFNSIASHITFYEMLIEGQKNHSLKIKAFCFDCSLR